MLAGAEVIPGTHGTWRDLVSALQRHTVHSELAQLSKDDRQILSLAYLSGHSNREIAAMLNVSVRTVSRRLTAALARLEESARRVGAWVSILGLALVALSARLAGAISRSDRMPAVTLVAAGTVTVVAIGLVVATPRMGAPAATAPPAQARQVPVQLPSVAGIDIVPASVVTDSGLVPAPVKTSHAGGNASGAPQTGGATSGRVCGGNPTSAAPVVPVGRRPGNPPAQPVTHPGAHNGGCGQ